MKIRNSKVLLTGATGGIGQAIARELTTYGAQVLLTGRNSKILERLASELNCEQIACDLSNEVQTKALLEKVGDVDIYIANAGIPGAGSTLDLESSEIDNVIDVNLRVPIKSSTIISRSMITRGAGHIVFISSLSGLVASPTTMLYSATKFGLRGYALSLRQELAPKGVGVSVILPGFIRDAGMFAEARVDLPRGTRTKAPQDVSSAVMSAIENNIAEILVAPIELRIGAKLGTVFPRLAEIAQNAGPARAMAERLRDAQRNVH